MVKKIALFAIPLLLIASVIGAILFIPGLTRGNSESLIPDMLAQIEQQTKVDQMLLEELNSGAYSFDEPLVVTDPYGVSPLTAIALFTSEEPMNISVHISGKTKLADVDFTFDGYNTNHQIPIYGLYSGELNTVELTAKLQDGTEKNTTLEIQTDPLPPELAKNIIMTELAKPNSYQPGFNYTFTQKTAFDVNGDYRWYYNSDYSLFMIPNIYNYCGNFLFIKGSKHQGDVLLFELNALGKILSVYYSPYGVHHDIAAIDGKNLIVTGSDGETIEDFIYEIDVETGKIVNTMDLKKILQRTRIINQQDWFHHNSTVYDNGSIIISGRNQSAVVKLSWPEGEIDWILSDHYGWAMMFQQYLLDPVGDDFEWSYFQHDPEIMPDYDSNPDTIDILLFDNNSTLTIEEYELQLKIASNGVAESEMYSRMVHYRINEKERTVEQIWQFGKEYGEAYYAFDRGDANLLENDNRLGTFDLFLTPISGGRCSVFPEVTAEGEMVWEAYVTTNEEISSFISAYRLERHLPYTYAANDLQIGTPARNLIPEDKLP